MLITAFNSAPIINAQEVPGRVYCTDHTVRPGNAFTLFVRAEDFSEIAALDVALFFDSTLFTLVSVTRGEMIKDTVYVISNDDMSVSLNAVSAQALEGSGTLLSIHMRCNSGASPGVYKCTLTAGQCYGTDLSSKEVACSSSTIKIESVTNDPPQQLRLYSLNTGSSTVGDLVTVRFCSYSVVDLGVLDFVSRYDENVLALQSASLSSKLTNAALALWSVNTDVPGEVKVSYVSGGGVTGELSPIVTLVFKVIKNTSASTAVSFVPTNACDIKINEMVLSDCTSDVSLYKSESTFTSHIISLSKLDESTDSITLCVKTEGLAGLAAVDLTVTYDKEILRCVAVEDEGAGTLVSNIRDNDGKVTISFIRDGGLENDASLCTLRFEKQHSINKTDITLTGKNPVNDSLRPINVEYKSTSVFGNTPAETKKGDIDNDGRVNAYDVYLLMHYLVGWGSFNSDQIYAADYHEDGRINNRDIITLLLDLVNGM